MSKPHFICIGAQRSGTDWLYEQLKNHPDIWLPPVKEIHYFDRRYPPAPLVGGESQPKHRPSVFNYRKLRSYIGWLRRTDSFAAFRWLLKYSLRGSSDDWYKSLFNRKDERLTGDITPAYSTLDRNAVAKVKEVSPDAKIIYILRDPVDRAWSQALRKFTYLKSSRPEDLSSDVLDAFFESPVFRLRNDYLMTIENWLSMYDRKQVHFILFDDLIARSDEVLCGLCRFLEIPYDKSFFPEAGERKNSGPLNVMPPRVREALSKKYLDDMERLAKMFGGPTEKWLKRARESIASG